MKGTGSYIKISGLQWPLQLFISNYYQASPTDWKTAQPINFDGNAWLKFDIEFIPKYFLVVNWDTTNEKHFHVDVMETYRQPDIFATYLYFPVAIILLL